MSYVRSVLGCKYAERYAMDPISCTWTLKQMDSMKTLSAVDFIQTTA
jgi:hypothetical protein